MFGVTAMSRSPWSEGHQRTGGWPTEIAESTVGKGSSSFPWQGAVTSHFGEHNDASVAIEYARSSSL
jgi:hypothetical protein